MPIHDWTRTYDGAIHYFHVSWLVKLTDALNEGLLPSGFYALGEQVIGGAVPDILTLSTRSAQDLRPTAQQPSDEASAALPSATLMAIAEAPRYPPRPRVIGIRHRSGDRLVAMIEIVSAGNKNDAAEVGALLDKTLETLSKGIHVVLIDLHPPGAYDPQGLHGLLWSELGQDPMALMPDKPLCVASYLSRKSISCFLEPRAVGEPLPAIPLFLSPTMHVALPLERTYMATFEALPAEVRAAVTQEQ